MRRFLILSGAFAILVVPFISLAWAPGQPIVPQCFYGGGSGPFCQACDLVTLLNNLLAFAVYFSAFIATVMFAYAGFLYVTAASNPGNLETAKKIFSSVLLGFFFVLTAWLIIDIILSTFTNKDFGFWSNIECVQPPKLSDAAGSVLETGNYSGTSSTCQNCVNITAFQCSNPQSCQVPPEVNAQLEATKQAIIAAGGDPNDYRITETGVNTTVQHASGSANLDISCNSKGTGGSCSTAWLATLKSSWSGTVVYETNSQADYDEKIKAGIPKENILGPDWFTGTFVNGVCSAGVGHCITAPHASLKY